MLARLILISGYDRSGKSTAASLLVNCGYHSFECGAFVKSRSQSTEKIAVSKLYEEKMDEFNSNIHSSLVNKCSTHNKIAVVGVRSIDLFNLLKNTFPDLKLIFIESNQNVRYKRHLSHSTQLQSLNAWDTFQSVDRMQDDWGLNRIKLNADFIVVNNESSFVFEQNIKSILETL